MEAILLLIASAFAAYMVRKLERIEAEVSRMGDELRDHVNKNLENLIAR